ncbi:uncharacterized protein LKV04_008389 [Tautogolabrus adspersus]
MEEPQAILKFFRALTEEENEDFVKGDPELIFYQKKNEDRSFEDVLENSEENLSYVILPREGQTLNTRSITGREGENGLDMTEEERNNFNLKSMDANKKKQSFATHQEQNKMPDKRCDEATGRSNVGRQLSLDESALNESLKPKCQLISKGDTNTDYDCAAPLSVSQDVTKDDKQKERKDNQNVQSHEEFGKSSSNGDAAEERVKAKETTTSEQTSFFKNEDEEERSGAEEDIKGEGIHEEEEHKEAGGEERKEEYEKEEEEKRDYFPVFSAQPNHASIPKRASLNIIKTSPPVAKNPPPGSTITRATFSPGSHNDKQIQLPALFSGLRVLKKGVVGPANNTVAQIKHSSEGARREIFGEKNGWEAKVHGSFLDQISQFLSREKRGDEKEEMEENTETEEEGDAEDTGEKSEESQESETKELETEEDAEVTLESSKPPTVSSAEAAFDAFKAFFTPKPLKKDPADKADLEAIRKRIKADRDVLKALFERASDKTPEKKESPDCKVRMKGHITSNLLCLCRQEETLFEKYPGC